ncbi:hypothetical protein ACHWQZ_G008578 [Mnemiopsis leidyi]
MDHSRYLIDLLQKAELKAKMSLYYLREVGEIKEEKFGKDNMFSDINELYNSSQIYCSNLEKQLKEKNGEIKRIQQASDEVTRHNEAMSEEISHLSNKLEMYPKTIQDLKAEIEKLSTKVSKLEEQKKFMEQQAAQNEARLQQSQSIQQDLIQSQEYIYRLKKYLDTPRNSNSISCPVPVLQLDKTSQTCTNSPSSSTSSENGRQTQVQAVLKDQSQTISKLRYDLTALKKSCSDFNVLQDELNKIKQLVESRKHSSCKLSEERNKSLMSGDEIKCENGLHENDVDEKDERNVDKPTTIPIQYLLNVERVEVIGRVLPPDSDRTLTTYTNNTNNTDVIVNDNNNISTYSLDLVIPMNASEEQLTWFVARISGRVKEQRSVMIVMLGESDLTMYGTPHGHGLLRHLLKALLSMKKSNEQLTLSVGTFVNNQMCDGLSEFSSEDGKVTAVSLTNLEQGIELLSQADIPDETEHVLHQFTFRKSDESTRSVSILECGSVDNDSCELLHDFRASGKVPSGSRPSVLYDTVHAYIEKGGAVTVFLNLKPEIQSTADSQRLLKCASGITGVEPVTQFKKRGLFSFRS